MLTFLDDRLCPEAQPAYSAFRDPSFGHGECESRWCCAQVGLPGVLPQPPCRPGAFLMRMKLACNRPPAPTILTLQACWCCAMRARLSGAGCAMKTGQRWQQTVRCCTAQSAAASGRRQQESSRRSQGQPAETAAAEGVRGRVCWHWLQPRQRPRLCRMLDGSKLLYLQMPSSKASAVDCNCKPCAQEKMSGMGRATVGVGEGGARGWPVQESGVDIKRSMPVRHATSLTVRQDSCCKVYVRLPMVARTRVCRQSWAVEGVHDKESSAALRQLTPVPLAPTRTAGRPCGPRYAPTTRLVLPPGAAALRRQAACHGAKPAAGCAQRA